MIREATQHDIDVILEITAACAEAMNGRGIHQWNVHYPSRAAFENDVQRGELYVLELEQKPIACIVISTEMDAEYESVEWLTPNIRNLYIHRLAVHPNYQRQGFAQQLMAFAENYAHDHRFASIRLDTFSQNQRNQEFYERRGYQRLGTIYFPKQSHHPFYCYERLF